IARDITTLVWLQHMRQESEQRLRQLTENISEVLWLADVEQGQMLYVSPACTTVWGIRREQLYEQPASLLDMVHAEDRERVIAAATRHPHGGFDEEYRVIRPDGEERWVHASTFPIRNSAGVIYRVAGIAKDITDYKRLMATEHEQRLLAEALRDIANALNSTRDMPEVLDRLLIHIEQVVPHDAAEIMLVKDGVARVVRSRGYDSRGFQEELEALRFPVHETPNLRYMSQTRKPLIISDVLDTNADTPTLKSSPALFWRSSAGVPICSRDEVMGFINLCSLTPYFFTPIHADRLQGFAEQAAIAIRNALLLEQARELAAHQERQRLARDLHDAVSQTLFSATITAEAFVRQWERDPASVGPKLADLHRLTRGALAETRAVLLELRPEALTDIGFEELLHQLAEAVQSRKRLDITLDLEKANMLSPDVKLVLYRIAQEALNNIMKHARASSVVIRLTRRDGHVMLDIRDNGQGFDPANIRPASLGLGFMRERAESIDAKLDIISAPGAGTQIVVTWPNQMGKGTTS
ncbi:MAG: PAS domain S-box protein, partial [Chloroflexi bacterium]